MAVKKWRGKWVVDVIHDGKRIRRVSPEQSRRGAARYEVELLNALLSETSSRASSSMPGSGAPVESPGLADFAVEWLTTYAVVNNKPSEVVNKESVLRVHLIPFFDNRRLDQIDSLQIERYKAAKLKGDGGRKPLSAKTINNHLIILRKLLVTAVEWKCLETVPRIRRLKTPPARFDWLTPRETMRFLAAIEQHYPQWRALFWAAVRTGLRRGELFALEWSHVDLVARTLHVRQSVYRGRLVTPKGYRMRSIPMTGRLTEVMAEHKRYSRSRLVFPAADGGLTTHQDHVNRPHRGALRHAGLREVRFHDLRHTFASHLVSAGRSLKEVQELLGHQSMQMTLRYAHLAPERMRAAVDVLEDPDLFGEG